MVRQHLPLLIFAAVTSCGIVKDQPKSYDSPDGSETSSSEDAAPDKDTLEKYDKTHGGILTSVPETSPTPDEASSAVAAAAGSIVPISCKTPKADLAWANAVTQTLFGRDLNSDERKKALAGSLNRSAFVDEALKSSEATNGVSKFVTNLFRLGSIVVNPTLRNAAAQADAILVSDLQKEPVELVLRNLDKPWAYFFTTRDIFCTKNTAPIYEVTELESGAFVPCKLPSNRAGFLGLASVLRANSSSFASTNNNYHRVAFALYLAQGFKLLQATNGAKGEGRGMTMPMCAATSDMRKDEGGLIYGSAAVPMAGPVCASCHARYNGPLAVAFRHFAPDGRTYSIEDIQKLNDNDVRKLGTSKGELISLLNETKSCWSADGISPPRDFAGVPGFGRLIAESGTLGKALGVQVPALLGNESAPDANMTSSIAVTFAKEGETLKAAFKGYLMSDSFQCAVKGE